VSEFVRGWTDGRRRQRCRGKSRIREHGWGQWVTTRSLICRRAQQRLLPISGRRFARSVVQRAQKSTLRPWRDERIWGSARRKPARCRIAGRVQTLKHRSRAPTPEHDPNRRGKMRSQVVDYKDTRHHGCQRAATRFLPKTLCGVVRRFPTAKQAPILRRQNGLV